MTFRVLKSFADMKDKFLPAEWPQLPRYDHTRSPGDANDRMAGNHFSQPLPSIITLTAGQKALLAHL